MNWKLVFVLSLFGLAMGVATVFVVPSNVEPICWLAIFLVCAFLVAKRAPGRYFVHGLCVSLVNSVWIVAAHEAFFDFYVAGHAQEAARGAKMAIPGRVTMLVMGSVVGCVSGLVLGLFCFVASKFVAPAAPVPAA